MLTTDHLRCSCEFCVFRFGRVQHNILSECSEERWRSNWAACVYMHATHTQTSVCGVHTSPTQLLRVENLAHRDLLEDTALELNSMHSPRIVWCGKYEIVLQTCSKYYALRLQWTSFFVRTNFSLPFVGPCFEGKRERVCVCLKANHKLKWIFPNEEACHFSVRFNHMPCGHKFACIISSRCYMPMHNRLCSYFQAKKKTNAEKTAEENV